MKKKKNPETEKENFFDFVKCKKPGAYFWGVLFCTIALAVFGCVAVFSASSYSAQVNIGDKFYFLKKQIFGVVLGLGCIIFFSFVNYNKLQKFKWWGVLISFALLGAVLIPGIGIAKNGAQRWLGIGSYTFQPSEIAKFALVLFCASHLSEKYNKTKKIITLLPPLLVGALFCLLVILEPNMSITIVLGATLILMLFIGGISFKHFAILGVPACAFVPALIVLEPYRLKRISAFLDPWANPRGEGFQLLQSLYALGSGGLFGVGLFNSRQKYLFLPFAESDFIFAIIGEELGFVGSLGVLGAYFMLIFFLIKIGQNANNRFGALLSVGTALVIGIQILLNIAVVSGSIPPTGVPLPLISAGSTSIIVLMSAIGICLNVCKQSKKSVLSG